MTPSASTHVVIAIDGPSGGGKSTAAKRLALTLGYWYVDSGAMYRAVGWVVHAHTVTFDDHTALGALLDRTSIELTFLDGQSEVWVDGFNITHQLGGEPVGKAASAVAIQPMVRHIITKKLRECHCQADLVMEGRDIGTVVFPDATLKFFLEASQEARAQRRFQEMRQVGQQMTLEQVRQALTARDTQDQTRVMAPLTRASDAHIIDTTDLTVDDVVQIMLSGVREQILQRNA